MANPPKRLADLAELHNFRGDLENTRSTVLQRAAVDLGLDLIFSSHYASSPRLHLIQAVLGKGQTLRKVKSMAAELAVRLGVSHVTVRPEPGQPGVITFEVERNDPERIVWQDLYDESGDIPAGQTGILLGLDTANAEVCPTLATLPHLLLAGATGTGKSVALRSILMSLVANNSANDVELYLIDPKQVELQPWAKSVCTRAVTTNPTSALAMLKHLVGEMEFRYTELRGASVTDLPGYNVWAEQTAGEYPMARIVIVIDELADLFAGDNSSAVEEALLRLAQMGRAAGIHLIAATQLPTATVIPSQLKSQFPARLACAVASSTDSRVILDQAGAEKLLGAGDALLMQAGQGLTRLQIAYTGPEEVAPWVELCNAHYGPRTEPEPPPPPKVWTEEERQAYAVRMHGTPRPLVQQVAIWAVGLGLVAGLIYGIHALGSWLIAVLF